MGSAESTTRKVSFSVDEEDRVRILRGIKVTLKLALDIHTHSMTLPALISR